MKNKKKAPLKVRIAYWVPLIITIVLFVVWIWVYRNVPLKGWKLYGAYFGFFFISLIQALTFVFMAYPSTKNDITKAGMYAGDCLVLICFLYTIFLFPIHSTFRRTLFIIPLIIAYNCIPQKYNHDKREFTGDHAFAYNFALLTLMQIYYIWKNYDGHRIINIILCFAYAYISTIRMQNIEDIEEYDKEEDRYMSSKYAKATKTSFEKVLRDQGVQGEYYVSSWLEAINSYSKVLYSLYTPDYTDENGKEYWVSELDAVVISKNGIDVLEIKNQKKTWNILGEGPSDCICYDRYNKVIINSPNPFSQNRVHKKNLKHLFSQDKFLSQYKTLIGGYIVFGPETINYTVDNSNVKQGYAYFNQIGKLLDKNCKKNQYLTDQEIDKIYAALKQYENNKLLEAKHRRSLGY